MTHILDIQFYKLGSGGTVGDILTTTYLPRDSFADEAAWKEWASESLGAYRTERNLRWPEGVRALDDTGQQVFNWTFFDDFSAKHPLRTAMP